MKKLLFLLLACTSLITVGCEKQKLASDSINVGAIVELTGSIPAVGASSKNGMELAVNEINAQGGILVNGKKMPVRLDVQDNGAQADQSASAAQKLISQDNVVAILGPNASLGAIPAAEIAEGAKTLLITPWSTNPKATRNSATGQPKHYVFRACFTDPFEGHVLASFARNNLKYQTAAVLYDVSSEAPTSQAAIFKQDFEKQGGKVVAFETYSTNDKDFSAQLTKIKAAKPDVLFLPAYYNDVPLIAQQAKRLGLQVAFLGSDAWSSPELLKLANGAVEGAYFANHYSPDAKTAATEKFVTDYQKAYGKTPDDVAALSYDAAKILFNAIAAAGTLDRQAIRDSMAKLPVYAGVTGDIKYSADSGDPVKSAVIMQVKGNQFVWVANASAGL
ncbi:MAG TPA: ABC transporter substrate-binding protein [Gammaproteobacteria bacterium]|nr:ABC transporter substrate-binding protein [Gammaproteobacteria bacterium]